MMNFSKKINILLVIIFFLIIPFLAKSQLAFSIFPEKFDLKLSPGESTNGKIRISNLSQTSLPINIQLKNFSASGERGEIIFEEGGDISFDPSQWIEFKEKKFVLKQGEFKELEFFIKIPANAEPGGYYTSVLFQTEISSTGKESSAKIMPTLGALFLLTIKGGEQKYPSLDKQIEITELNAPSFIENGPLSINFKVKNNDPTHTEVGGKFILYDLFGKIREEIKIEPKTILPGKIRLFELKTSDKKFFDKFFLGPYKGKIILATSVWQEKIGNNQQLVKNIGFFAFPWKIFLITISLIIIIIFSIKLIKKLIKKSSKTSQIVDKKNAPA